MYIPSFKLISQSMLKKSPENADGRTDGRTDRRTDGRTLPRHNTSRFSNGRIIKIIFGLVSYLLKSTQNDCKSCSHINIFTEAAHLVVMNSCVWRYASNLIYWFLNEIIDDHVLKLTSLKPGNYQSLTLEWLCFKTIQSWSIPSWISSIEKNNKTKKIDYSHHIINKQIHFLYKFRVLLPRVY